MSSRLTRRRDAGFVDVSGIFAGFCCHLEIAHQPGKAVRTTQRRGFFFDFVLADFNHFDGNLRWLIGFLGKTPPLRFYEMQMTGYTDQTPGVCRYSSSPPDRAARWCMVSSKTDCLRFHDTGPLRTYRNRVPSACCRQRLPGDVSRPINDVADHSFRMNLTCPRRDKTGPKGPILPFAR